MSAKDIVLKAIDSKRGNAFVAKHHYSGKTAPNSQLHVGVFLRDVLSGVMQLGPPMDRGKVLPLVEGTRWNGMLELNRMAFSDRLPRNSESRAMAVLFRLLRKVRPDVEWILSYADATQCGDGTIYRAAGFLLTGIKPNGQVWVTPCGHRFSKLAYQTGPRVRAHVDRLCGVDSSTKNPWTMSHLRAAGCREVPGFQIRYIKPLAPNVRERLTVAVLPYSEIERRGARMYRGARVPTRGAHDNQHGKGGASPTHPLHDTRGDS